MRSLTKSAAVAALAGAFLFGQDAMAQSGEYRIDVRTDLPDGDFVVYKGDRFRVSFTPSHDSYVMILALDKKGNVRILFPNRHQPENFVSGGDEVSIDDIYADYTGPVYIEAVALGSQSYELHYGDRFNPVWNDQRWGKYDASRSFVSEHRGTFTVSFDDAVSANQPTYSARYEADEMGRELDQRITEDYDSFEPEVRDFRDEVYEIVGGETWTSGYVDVYVAERRYNPAAYGGEADEQPAYDDEGDGGSNYASYYDYTPSDFDYEVALSGYGTWIDVRGVRVWRPPVFDFGWRPYQSGYWCHTRFGWYWVGYEPFAWVVYHYGYWYYDPFYGWYWIPDYWGYNWTPANCYWHVWGDYISWYPAPPPARIAVNLNISVEPRWDPARAIVVKKGNFMKPNIAQVVEAPANVTTFLHAPDFKEGGAPRPEIVEKAIGQPVKDIAVKSVEKPAAKAGKKVVIVKPEEMKAPPKEFKELDDKVRREVAVAPRPRPATPGATPAPRLTPRPKPEHVSPPVHGGATPAPEKPTRPMEPTPPAHTAPPVRTTPAPAPERPTRPPAPAPTPEHPTRPAEPAPSPHVTPPAHTAPPPARKPPERETPPRSTPAPPQHPSASPLPPEQSKPAPPPALKPAPAPSPTPEKSSKDDGKSDKKSDDKKKAKPEEEPKPHH
ncbi:MAG: DUF6600 domain-containing protein [Acidobacteriota bacterium]